MKRLRVEGAAIVEERMAKPKKVIREWVGEFEIR